MVSKRIIAGTMAFVLAAMGTMTASAADTVTISGENKEVEAGSTFSYDISLAGVPASGVSAIEFAVKYDSSLVSVTDVKLGAAGETGASAKEVLDGAAVFEANYAAAGEIDVQWSTGLSDSYWVKSDGVFITISGKVSDTAKAGDSTAVEITAIDRETYEGSKAANTDIVVAAVSASGVTEYTAAGKAGKITVKDAGTTETTEPVTKDPSKVLYGDANVDGEVTVSDVIMLNKGMLGTAILSDQGKINSKVYLKEDGTPVDGPDISSMDVVLVMRYLVGSVTLPSSTI